MSSRTSLLLLLLTLAGCSLLDAATKERPGSTQRTAIGETFAQVGTIAAMANDPGSVGNDDLVTAMTFDHFARLVAPSAKKPIAAIELALAAAAPPGCVAQDGDTRAFDCEVTLPDGRQCVVSGSVRREPRGAGNAYVGTMTLGGDETCPAASATIDVYLEGPTSRPTVANGTVAFSYADPGGDSFGGTCVLDEIAVTEKCPDAPASGELTVSVQGTAGGDPVNGSITLSFRESPGCGVIFIE